MRCLEEKFSEGFSVFVQPVTQLAVCVQFVQFVFSWFCVCGFFWIDCKLPSLISMNNGG